MPRPTSKRASFGSPLTNMRPPSPWRPDVHPRLTDLDAAKWRAKYATFSPASSPAAERRRPMPADGHGLLRRAGGQATRRWVPSERKTGVKRAEVITVRLLQEDRGWLRMAS